MTPALAVLALAVFVALIVAACAICVVQWYAQQLADTEEQLREADAELVNVAQGTPGGSMVDRQRTGRRA